MRSMQGLEFRPDVLLQTGKESLQLHFDAIVARESLKGTWYSSTKILDLARLQTREKIGNFDIYVEELALTLLTLSRRLGLLFDIFIA